MAGQDFFTASGEKDTSGTDAQKQKRLAAARRRKLQQEEDARRVLSVGGADAIERIGREVLGSIVDLIS